MNRLETATNIIVIIAAAVVAGNNVYGRFVAPKQGSERAQHLVGKSLALPAALPVGRRGTIALFVSKDCHFCRESMDFYRQLASVVSEDDACDVKLLAVGPQAREGRGDLVNFLADQKLKVDGVDVVDFPSLAISGTPTLALLDSSSIVKNVWAGLLPPTSQKEVLARVKLLCR